MDALNVEPRSLRYAAMIGTGGIGSGSFFELKGDHTLGREESRAGRFLDRRDYCKLHIIAHYVQALLGTHFHGVPIGAVGDDDVGRALLAEMAEVGMDVSRVATIAERPTLFSFCFVYPDGSGGNLTTDDSASAHVDGDLIRAAEAEFAAVAGKGIALAAPEVPLEARSALLKLGAAHGLLRAASFTTEELLDPAGRAMVHDVELLALNADEAAAAAGIPSVEGKPPDSIAEGAAAELTRANPEMIVSITAGTDGSWIAGAGSLTHCPSCRAEVSGTAGAGDAHFAGLLVGLAVGLALPDAQQLATLVAGLSVTSPHTINKDIGRTSLQAFSQHCGLQLSDPVRALLEA